MTSRWNAINEDEIEDLLRQSDLEDADDENDEIFCPFEDQYSSNDSESDQENEQALPSLQPQSTSKWLKKSFRSKDLPDELLEELPDLKSPAEYFEAYFTEDLFEQFANATSQYYIAEKGQPMRPHCTPSEIKKFFGVHGMMSIVKCPRMKMYWNQKFKYDPIANAMSRERFFLLRVNLHVVDYNNVSDEQKNTNKLWKIQPVIEYGKTTEKQYVPNKPRPVGLKNFLVTTPQGLVLDFEIYQGATTDLPDRSFGLGPSVVLRLARTLPGGSLYFDRYFTTVPLLSELANRNLDGTGTLMTNRFKKNIYEFQKDRDMKRGDWEEVCSPGGKLCAVKWMDNKSVLMVSSIHGAEPKSSVSRWDKRTKVYKSVPCPSIVKNYNSNMGGIDLCDQMMETYRTWFKTKKWTVKVIIHMFDLAIVNSWFEYKEAAKRKNIRKSDIMDLLAFRLSIIDFLLDGPTRKRKRDDLELAEMSASEEYRPAVLPSIDRRYDGFIGLL